MTNMIRKQIYIEPEQEALLKRISGESGMSEAEIIREAISRHASNVSQPASSRRAWANMRAFIEKRLESDEQIQGGREWRREDLYDR